MFGKSNDSIKNKSQTYIAEEVHVSGKISYTGDLLVDGVIEGDLVGPNLDEKTKKIGKVVIGATGKVIGNIYCHSCSISGEVLGDIHSYELLSLESQAVVTGNVYYNTVLSKQGCVLEGSFIPQYASQETKEYLQKNLGKSTQSLPIIEGKLAAFYDETTKEK